MEQFRNWLDVKSQEIMEKKTQLEVARQRWGGIKEKVKNGLNQAEFVVDKESIKKNLENGKFFKQLANLVGVENIEKYNQFYELSDGQSGFMLGQNLSFDAFGILFSEDKNLPQVLFSGDKLYNLGESLKCEVYQNNSIRDGEPTLINYQKRNSVDPSGSVIKISILEKDGSLVNWLPVGMKTLFCEKTLFYEKLELEWSRKILEDFIYAYFMDTMLVDKKEVLEPKKSNLVNRLINQMNKNNCKTPLPQAKFLMHCKKEVINTAVCRAKRHIENISEIVRSSSVLTVCVIILIKSLDSLQSNSPEEQMASIILATTIESLFLSVWDNDRGEWINARHMLTKTIIQVIEEAMLQQKTSL